MNHLLQKGHRPSRHKPFQIVPIDSETVHVRAIDEKRPTVERIIFPEFGAPNIVDANVPIVIGAGMDHMVIGQSSRTEIVRVCIEQLLLRDVPLESMAFWVFAHKEQTKEFSGIMRAAGLRSSIVTTLRIIAKGKSSIEIIRLSLHESKL